MCWVRKCLWPEWDMCPALAVPGSSNCLRFLIEEEQTWEETEKEPRGRLGHKIIECVISKNFILRLLRTYTKRAGHIMVSLCWARRDWFITLGGITPRFQWQIRQKIMSGWTAPAFDKVDYGVRIPGNGSKFYCSLVVWF